MSKGFHHLLENTRDQVKKLRDRIKQLKKEQKKKRLDEALLITKATTPPQSKAPERQLVEFSMASVAKATLVILGLLVLAWFLFEIKQILILIFISLFLAAALDGIVDKLEEKKIPRAIGILLIYLLFLVVMGLFISTLVPLVASQTLELAFRVRDIVTNLAQGHTLLDIPYADRLQQLVNETWNTADREALITNLQGGLQQLGSQLQNIAGNTVSAVKILFNGILNAALVMVITFFMLVDENGMQNFLLSLFPSRHSHYIIAKSEAIKEKIGYWLRGQFKLMLAIAVITYVALTLLGVEYALTLGLIAGMTELLPVIGPIIAMVPALLIGLNESLGTAAWILAIYLIIQQLEGNLLVPLIMNKAVGLSPLIILVAMLVGYQFLGILGIMISVPVATALSIFIKDYTIKAK